MSLMSLGDNCKSRIWRFFALLPIFAVLHKSPTHKSMWIYAKLQILAKSLKNRLNWTFAIVSWCPHRRLISLVLEFFEEGLFDLVAVPGIPRATDQ